MNNFSIEWPLESKSERQYLSAVLKSRQWWSREGEFTRKFEHIFSEFLGVKHSFCCVNGTISLEIALKSLDIGFLDYVIVPSVTFISTALAVLKVGAYPIFADINLSTACIDLESIKRVHEGHENKVKAIIIVHLGGQTCDLEPVIFWAKEKGISIVEDCAQALGGMYKNKYLGGVADVGCFSFQNSKNITSGEGGAIVTNNDDLAIKINKYLDFNLDYSKQDIEFKYLSGNYRISEFQSAVLLAQLERFSQLQHKRELNYQYLLEELSNIDGIVPLERKSYITKHGCHFFMFRYTKTYFGLKSKSEFMEYLQDNGIPCFEGYKHIPLDQYPYFKNRLFLEYDPLWARLYKEFKIDLPSQIDCSNALCFAREFVWFPQFVLLREKCDLAKIVSLIISFKSNSG